MFAALKKLVHDCLTENDGTSYCPFRVAGFALSATGIPTFIGGTLWDIYRSGHFDSIAFAGSFTAMMGGLTILATGVAIKARTDAPAGN